MPFRLPHIPAKDHTLASYKHYEVMVHVYVVVLLVSNLVGQKPTQVGPFIFSGAELLFPLTYIFSDIFTEVYGYAGSRRAIWLAFFANILMGFFALFMVWIPPAPSWPATHQLAFEIVFGTAARGIVASLAAFWVGEFVNSYVMARMKVWSGGRWLWTRTIGSTVAGQLVDSLIVSFGLFAFTLPVKSILILAGSSYLAKVLYETCMTPLTYLVVHFLKKREGVDVYDEGTNFNPFGRERK
jgi:uncharacterized integral membrane protein (TIGR00697 family)